MSLRVLLATLAGIGVGLLVSVLLGLVGTRSFSSPPLLFVLVLVGSAAAIGGAGGLTTGMVARARKGVVKGLLVGAAVGVISEAVALAAAYLTTSQRAPEHNGHAALGTLGLLFFGLVGAIMGGPVAAALITAFRRPSVKP